MSTKKKCYNKKVTKIGHQPHNVIVICMYVCVHVHLSNANIIQVVHIYDIFMQLYF